MAKEVERTCQAYVAHLKAQTESSLLSSVGLSWSDYLKLGTLEYAQYMNRRLGLGDLETMLATVMRGLTETSRKVGFEISADLGSYPMAQKVSEIEFKEKKMSLRDFQERLESLGDVVLERFSEENWRCAGCVLNDREELQTVLGKIRTCEKVKIPSGTSIGFAMLLTMYLQRPEILGKTSRGCRANV